MKNVFETHPRTSFTVFGAVTGVIFGVFVVGNLPIAQSGGAFEGYAWLWGLIVGSYVGFRVAGREWRER